MEKREDYYTVGGNVNWCNHCGKQYGDFLRKLKVELPYDPAIPLLSIYPEKNHILKRNMYSNVHGSTTYNSQDMEAT